MKLVKMLVDVAEGAVAHKPGAKLKFPKDAVVPMSDATADKYVERKLGAVVEPAKA